MQQYIPRLLQPAIANALREAPAVALLGPRQCGKTSLARRLVSTRSDASYLDLELPSDRRKLEEPEIYFQSRRKLRNLQLFCLDEIQRVPELFPVLRGLIDQDGRNGQFLILGSASRDLIRQSSESLAGRMHLLELTPFLLPEVGDHEGPLSSLWLRGGFPRSYLADNDQASYRWRENFVQTFLERDIPLLGFNIPAVALHRLWRMLAHSYAQLLNYSKLATSLGVSHTTVRSYIDLLSQTFLVRVLEPLEVNLKKRLVKSPKVYIRDTGLLHSLLEIRDEDALLGHPVFGASWEGFVVETLSASLPEWRANFYRTAAGAEIDLVLTRGERRIAVECKASAAPKVSRGFHGAMVDLGIEEGWVVAPVDESYPLQGGISIATLSDLIAHYA